MSNRLVVPPPPEVPNKHITLPPLTFPKRSQHTYYPPYHSTTNYQPCSPHAQPSPPSPNPSPAPPTSVVSSATSPLEPLPPPQVNRRWCWWDAGRLIGVWVGIMLCRCWRDGESVCSMHEGVLSVERYNCKRWKSDAKRSCSLFELHDTSSSSSLHDYII